MRHPNIVRCLESMETAHGGRIVVMTLADGPDLGELVRLGGALSVSLARLAARHLVSAVAYLHGRGTFVVGGVCFEQIGWIVAIDNSIFFLSQG